MPPRVSPHPSRGHTQRGARPHRGAPGGVASSTSSGVPAHIETVGEKRPGFGSSGRPLSICVNAFGLKVPDAIIYHYDGIFHTTFYLLLLTSFCFP